MPIVSVFNRDPVEGGLANSLVRPGGNITGLTFFAPQIDGKRIELLKEILPGATRVAYLGTNEDWEGPSGQSVRAVAQAVGLTVILAALRRLIAIAERAPLPNGPCAIAERAIEMAP